MFFFNCFPFHLLHSDVILHFHILKEFLGHHLQSIIGPCMKPVNGTAIDKGREHPETVPECVTDWTHGC